MTYTEMANRYEQQSTSPAKHAARRAVIKKNQNANQGSSNNANQHGKY